MQTRNPDRSFSSVAVSNEFKVSPEEESDGTPSPESDDLRQDESRPKKDNSRTKALSGSFHMEDLELAGYNSEGSNDHHVIADNKRRSHTYNDEDHHPQIGVNLRMRQDGNRIAIGSLESMA